MVPSLTVGHSALLAGRAARNGCSHALIGTLLLVFVAPFVLIMSYIITAGLYEIGNLGSRVVDGFTQISPGRRPHRAPNRPVQAPPTRMPDRAVILKIMPLTVALLSAGLVILIWGMASATT